MGLNLNGRVLGDSGGSSSIQMVINGSEVEDEVFEYIFIAVVPEKPKPTQNGNPNLTFSPP